MSQSNGPVPVHVGKVRNGFLYTITSGLRSYGHPIYKCARGNTVGDNSRVYFLFKDSVGHWNAFEATSTSTNPANEGTPQFRTIYPVDDISQPA